MLDDEFTLRMSFLMAFFVVLLLFLSWYFSRNPMLDAIPTVGFPDPILSYFSALQFNFDGVRMLREGYKKTRPGLFKIANFRRWMVLVVGSELLDDIRRAPDDVLSMIEPTIEVRYHALANQTANTHKDCLVPSTRIHARLIEHERRVPYGYNTF